ncbi:hypothetical protein HG530_008463 [Fusarium avenaceum]|nr:hypothetical protein HG530_008463 [Fusarium avenaceum]
MHASLMDYWRLAVPAPYGLEIRSGHANVSQGLLWAVLGQPLKDEAEMIDYSRHLPVLNDSVVVFHNRRFKVNSETYRDSRDGGGYYALNARKRSVSPRNNSAENDILGAGIVVIVEVITCNPRHTFIDDALNKSNSRELDNSSSKNGCAGSGPVVVAFDRNEDTANLTQHLAVHLAALRAQWHLVQCDETDVHAIWPSLCNLGQE